MGGGGGGGNLVSGRRWKYRVYAANIPMLAIEIPTWCLGMCIGTFCVAYFWQHHNYFTMYEFLIYTARAGVWMHLKSAVLW